MGLTSLWSSITGPRIKEISPPAQTPWLEKPNPISSSASVHTTKSSLHRLKPGFGRDKRPKTGNSEKKLRKKASHLDISRPQQQAESKKVDAAHATKRNSLEDMVEVPALPSTFSPESRHILDEAAIENARPGTAITADEVVTIKTFELPADEIWCTSDKPLPSPASLPFLERSSEPLGQGIGSRKRSNSTASGKPRQKRASWFQVGKRKAVEFELPPPPLPPPKDPPPTPPKPSAVSPFYTGYLNQPKPARSVLELPTPSHLDVTRTSIAKDSLDGDSLLEAFPSVPEIVTPAPEATDAGWKPSEGGRDSPVLPIPPRSPLRNISRRSSAASTNKPRTPAPMQNIDGVLKTTNAANETEKHDSKQSPAAKVVVENHTSMSFSEDLQREYDRTLRLLDHMDHKRSSGFIQVVRTSSSDPARLTLEQKFSNEEALAALEFGLQANDI